jgi:hypothetical protein
MTRTHDEHGQVIDMDHPAKASTRKLTEKQAELLSRICRTNGGGISARDADRSVLRGLMNRHFVQGKEGHAGHVVHTREGLLAWRELEARA